MTDRELLELAAKAAGIEYDFICPTGAHCGDVSTMQDFFWNPLTDDGDALRLAVKLGIVVSAGSKENKFVCANPDSKAQILEERRPDPFAATRRAIVRAAAEIGEEVK